MRHPFAMILLTSLLTVPIGDLCRAELKAVWEVNRGESAQANFKFEKVPSPSATDAANGAEITLLSGQRDRNGGELQALQDGQSPANSDAPRQNFFFSQGTSGGRILLDLGQPTEIQQINTYSWHRSSRGPQVYKLYADYAGDDNFSTKLPADADPLQAGWKLLAEVDTRQDGDEPGGQYAVSIADSDAPVLGTYRYLLLEVSSAAANDRFGNTFFSEIDILDGKQHEPPAPPAGLEVVKLADETEIVLDTTQMPEIRRWVEAQLRPVCVEWYPKIVDLLPSDEYTAPRRFTIVFDKDSDGVAYCSGTTIHCAGTWFMRNLQGEAAGAVVHEMVHVVQQYRGRGGRRNPSWLVEGVADYIRWYLYEPEKNRPRVNPDRANYSDSYRTTAAFLHYVMEHHNPQIVKTFNADMRAGNYQQESWEKYTGSSVEDLWAEYAESLRE